jgi:DNA-binding IscR family transcriptional regulator
MTHDPMIPSDTAVVLSQLSAETPMSRAELRDKTGLSKSQVEDALAALTTEQAVTASEGNETLYRLAKKEA